MIKLHNILLAALLSLCITSVQAQAPLVKDLGYRGGSIRGIKKPANALHFIVMGDWGRNGENYQKEVAEGMGKAAHDVEAAFVVATGDNFYPYGVASTRDHHWISSFESVYTAQSLHVKWHPVLGNHDYASNPDAQLEYSQVSSRWDMPARYYSKTFSWGGDTLLMVFIDTDPMEKELRGARYDGVKYVKGAVAAQMQWLENLLAGSTARWKMVVGHHPLYTGGWRKDSRDTRNLRNFLEPVFNRNKVDVYIAGHEHHLEHIKPEGPTHYIISGAASEARPVAIYPGGGKFAAATQGFAVFSVTREQVLVQFIDYRDTILHETTIIRTAPHTTANAHAHNDYQQAEPYWNAWRNGFGSVEADIFLHEGELLVAHDRQQLTRQWTLDSLYLQPLQQCIVKNKGYVYADTSRTLQLMIDIKSEPVPALQKLVQQLAAYPQITAASSLKIIITGNKPPASDFASWPAWIYFDGDPKKDYSPPELQRIGLFSDNFARHSFWKGAGVMAEKERLGIDSLVRKAHRLNKKIRFWNAPDTPESWRWFVESGIDFINTDRIEELSKFLLAK